MRAIMAPRISGRDAGVNCDQKAEGEHEQERKREGLEHGDTGWARRLWSTGFGESREGETLQFYGLPTGVTRTPQLPVLARPRPYPVLLDKLDQCLSSPCGFTAERRRQRSRRGRPAKICDRKVSISASACD